MNDSFLFVIGLFLFTSFYIVLGLTLYSMSIEQEERTKQKKEK